LPFLSFHNAFISLRRYNSYPVMLSPPKLILTSSLSQPPRLGDTPGLVRNTGIRSVHSRSPSEITPQVEGVGEQELTIEQQERAKQICNADQARFRQLYDNELRRKRPGLIHRVRPRGPNKRFLATESYLEPNEAAQEELQAKQICNADQVRFRQIHDEELRAKRSKQSSSREAPLGQKRLRARQEQRVKDD
jgi:hypothetical protein